MAEKKGEMLGREITIKAPNMQTAVFTVRGTAPYMQCKFSEKAKNKMMAKMREGDKAKSRKAREPRDFDADCEAAKHIASEGWCGIPAPAFRCAMISACKICGFAMTRAKLAVFVEPDGFDATDGTPLVRITKGQPIKHEGAVRNDDGSTDIRARPMWREWEAVVRVRFDGDMFAVDDVANLLLRAGTQVGIGEGRPDSRYSTGLGFGLFEILKDAKRNGKGHLNGKHTNRIAAAAAAIG